ncbi:MULTISPECIES: DUF262 domain-containing protein [unclassified Francisella]|uniref:DUF262 domain-containing protein n=1 Tax=unclassified Francisella TaxID=2610885 RepID=UPI002E2ED58B|nr:MULTISPECIES: DUF262 domain-containing protein [unclassified Francisella]MED7818504.1 DUF262 domain-containing protein [Francisella sp. 19S2-4]MED7829340.1 DUF262 domain-containing protein [Francisella sp. 19S2-10]
MIKKAEIVKVKDLIGFKELKIPEYQRPYKWTLKNVNQLIDDILYFKDKKSYRLGTIVLHEEQEFWSIVDGQQRTTTLFLIYLAISKTKETLLSNHIDKNINFVCNLEFDNKISQYNIQKNYREIERRVTSEFNDIHVIDFFLEKCQIVLVTLGDISEAFQFFDSQNARGKDLEPHDLLKAFHLREMSDSTAAEKTKVVETWENMDQADLAKLFNDKLYRIRNWSRGNSAKYFTKNDVDLFKGISINDKTKDLEPYAKLYQIANIYVDKYNNNKDRYLDNNEMFYPFQLDLPVLNGKRFFEMISYYQNKYGEFKKDNKIIDLLNTYPERNRTGDKYIRMLFDCALIFYVDKFGEKEIDRVIEKLFVWAYSKRLSMQAIYLETIDNYALETKVFKTIRDAISYKDIVNMKVNIINKSDIKANIDESVKNKILGYFNAK